MSLRSSLNFPILHFSCLLKCVDKLFYVNVFIRCFSVPMIKYVTKATYRRMSLLGCMAGTAWQHAAGAGGRWGITHELWAQCCEHKVSSQSQIEWGYKLPKLITSDMLPSARVHLPNAPKQSQKWGAKYPNI